MCRIAGIASFYPVEGREVKVNAMIKALAHGGPDDEGTYFDNQVAFGHRRLSIIDLSKAGHQPMISADSQVVISYNGEIYNYKKLRSELEKSGRYFKTESDTEVILQAYLHWGVQAFDKFEGIFAFALYDKTFNKVLLVRDHIGVKPLYYSLADDQLIFASEVRAFKAIDQNWKENNDWKILFLAFGSIPQPYTTLNEVFQVPPGHYLELRLDNFKHSIIEYYFPQQGQTNTKATAEELLAEMKLTLNNAVRKNLISDAPIGIFLSGGVDSSLLTLLADQLQDGIKTISINFDEGKFDEYPYQKMVLERTRNVDHTSHRVTEHMFWDYLPDIWKAMDQPTIDGVNTYFVSKCAQRDGLKAVLSGLGADEIFGGYASFKRIRLIKTIRSFIPFKRTISNLLGLINPAYRRLMFLDLQGAVGDYLFLRGIHTPDSIAGLLEISEQVVYDTLKKVNITLHSSSGHKEYASQLESKIYMTNQLLKDTDGMSMWHGLEVHVPFLDIELLRKVETIPHLYRYSNSQYKYLITESHLDTLPKAIIHREKKGFTFPMATWLKNNPQRFREMIHHNSSVDHVIEGFENGKEHWSLAVLKQFS
jgi:asparagine synthase (glutamine-hydrolysing)